MSDTPYIVCRMADIPNRRARGFYLMRVEADGGERPWPIVVVRWGQQVLGYVNRCPHDGVKLDWEREQFLDADGTRLMCGKHGALFDLAKGECLDGPCRGRTLETVPLVVVDGDICVVGVTLAEEEEEGEGEDIPS